MKIIFIFVFNFFISFTGVLSFGALVKSDDVKFTATGKNLAPLMGLPIQVYLPTLLPAGYLLFDFTIEANMKTTSEDYPNYRVMYLKDHSNWFAIESTDSAGDADWENAKTTSSKSNLFGKYSIQWTKEVDPSEVIKSSRVISSWLKIQENNKSKIQLKLERYYHLSGRGLTSDEAALIINSLKLQNLKNNH